MSQVRNARLDSLCEAIGEDRQTMASARTDEQASLQAALREMKARGLSSYKHARIELAFVPGEDKIRARQTKDTEDGSVLSETSDSGEGESDDLGGGEAAEE